MTQEIDKMPGAVAVFADTSKAYAGRPDGRALCACRSIRGVRVVNQDMAAVLQMTSQEHATVTVAMVADGMGGGPCGELAAVMAVHTSCSFLVRDLLHAGQEDVPWDAAASMSGAFHAANQAIMEYSGQGGAENMGTTLTLSVIQENTLCIASVGDSRCYLRRAGAWEQLTHDDSFVQRLVDRGLLSPAEAESHPRANEITRALGWPRDLDDLSVCTHTLQDRDIILLCSDGLWKTGHDALEKACAVLDASHASAPEAQAILEIAASALVTEATERDSDDNISVVLMWMDAPVPDVRVSEDETNQEEK